MRSTRRIHYQLNAVTGVDLGYAHLVARNSSICGDQRATGGGLIDASYRSRVDLISAQLDYRIK